MLLPVHDAILQQASSKSSSAAFANTCSKRNQKILIIDNHCPTNDWLLQETGASRDSNFAPCRFEVFPFMRAALRMACPKSWMCRPWHAHIGPPSFHLFLGRFVPFDLRRLTRSINQRRKKWMKHNAKSQVFLAKDLLAWSLWLTYLWHQRASPASP